MPPILPNIAQIIVAQPLFGPLDYAVPEGMEDLSIGMLVTVPFRGKSMVGVVVSRNPPTVASSKIRSIEQHLDLPIMPAAFLHFLERVASYYMAPLGAVWKLVAPAFSLLIKPATKERSAKKATPELAPTSVTLSFEQQQALELLHRHRRSAPFTVSLLDGVTGSGKTEVYSEALATILQEQATFKHVLILLPEIALTSQLVERIGKRFGKRPGLWHSDMTPKERLITLKGLLDGSIQILIGARSALFLPFLNLCAIVVDEEHDASYKQDEGVMYQGRDMAILRAHTEQIPILLASATPSLETWLNCQQGKYQHFRLPSRYGEAALPNVHLIDMRQHKGSPRWLSTTLLAKIGRTLQDKKQAMLFLNRRGYAPLSLCTACGYRVTCPDCSVCLVEHRGTQQLVCHHCGYHQPLLSSCPECGGDTPLTAIGPGIERLEEEMIARFPDARILAFSRDTITTLKKMNAALTRILSHDVDIILGTQMLAKGHHFPAVECVGIIDADFGLMGADLRATERTYQLLHQVGGRAGRTSSKGEVWMQSYLPDLPIMKSLLLHDRDSFIEAEMKMREESRMPPFGKLAAILITARKEATALGFARHIASKAPEQEGITLLGPAPAPLAVLQQRFRYRILIKSDRNTPLQSYLKSWLSPIGMPADITMKVDIDPYQFM